MAWAKDGTRATYTLAAKASTNGMLWVTQTNTQGKTLVLPLVAAIRRDAAAVHAAAGKAHAKSQDAAGTANSAADHHPSTQAGGTVSAGGQASAAGSSVSGSAQVGAHASVQLPPVLPPLGKGKGH